MEEMALRYYGHGRWEAPYWFIGPEQGQGNERLECRIKAWIDLGAKELCDCRVFHERICDDRWHRDNKPALQKTWDKLVILLKAFKGEQTDDQDARRTYQRDRLGTLNGETCVIELSGLAAHDLKVDRGSLRTEYQPERIDTIRHRIAENRPRFVVFYGTMNKAEWQEIVGCELAQGRVVLRDDIALLMAIHPNKARGNQYWEGLGSELRRCLAHL